MDTSSGIRADKAWIPLFFCGVLLFFELEESGDAIVRGSYYNRVLGTTRRLEFAYDE